MPYKLSTKARLAIEMKPPLRDPNLWTALTNLQKKALEYLWDHEKENRFIGANEIAVHYGYPSGLYFRGVLASLYAKGLLVKEE